MGRMAVRGCEDDGKVLGLAAAEGASMRLRMAEEWLRRAVSMQRKGDADLAKGVVAGLLGGLIGSWVMLKFVEGPGPAFERAMQGRRKPTEEEERQQAASAESVTMQAAETFYHAGTGGHLTHAQRAEDGEVVHYAFGTLMGLGYGVVAEYAPVVGVGLGGAFATVLWAGTDLTSIPAVGFAVSPGEEPGSAHVSHWAAHVAYGMTMEGVRRLVRWVL